MVLVLAFYIYAKLVNELVRLNKTSILGRPPQTKKNKEQGRTNKLMLFRIKLILSRDNGSEANWPTALEKKKEKKKKTK